MLRLNNLAASYEIIFVRTPCREVFLRGIGSCSHEARFFRTTGTALPNKSRRHGKEKPKTTGKKATVRKKTKKMTHGKRILSNFAQYPYYKDFKQNPNLMTRTKFFWLLAAITFLSLFLFLGQTPFHTKGEPREAVVALSMLQQDNWTLPINNGVDMAYKPPFFHWCIAAVSTVAGEVNEYTSRFPSAFWLAVMVLVGYVFFAKRRGVEVAFLMGLLTLTNFEVHRAGVNCRVDMVLSALIVLAIYQLYKWGERGLRGIPWTGILCMSGAALTKGPVGIVLPCLVVAVFLWIRGYNFWRLLGRFAATAIRACILPMVWYLAAWRQGGDEFLTLVLEENVWRFLGKMSYESHENPWWYNVMTVLAGWTPYTLLGLMSLFVLKYNKKVSGGLKSAWKRLCDSVRRMDDARLLSLLATVLIFVFYCIPKSKRSVYLLPIYPFIAFFLAEYILWLCRNHRVVVRAFGHVLAGLSVILLALFAALQAGLVPDSIFGTGRHAAQNIAFKQALETLPIGPLAILVLAVLVIGIVIFWRNVRRNNTRALPYTVTGLVLAIFFSLDGLFQPAVLSVKSDKPVAEHIATLVPADAGLYSCHPDYPSYNILHPFTLNFYLDNRIVPFGAFFPTEGYLVAGDGDIAAFKQRYGSTYDTEEVWNSGHRSCDSKQTILLCKFHKKPDNTITSPDETASERHRE